MTEKPSLQFPVPMNVGHTNVAYALKPPLRGHTKVLHAQHAWERDVKIRLSSAILSKNLAVFTTLECDFPPTSLTV